MSMFDDLLDMASVEQEPDSEYRPKACAASAAQLRRACTPSCRLKRAAKRTASPHKPGICGQRI